MYATPNYSSFETSLTNAQAVIGLEWLYSGFRKSLSRLAVVLLLTVLGFPFVLFFGYWLKQKRKAFQKHMRSEFKGFKNHQDYLTYKDSLKRLDELMPGLKKVSDYNLNNAPWPVSFTLRQMQQMSSTLVTYNQWLKLKLSPYNNPQENTKSEVFKLVTESELWKARNHAYNYWM